MAGKRLGISWLHSFCRMAACLVMLAVVTDRAHAAAEDSAAEGASSKMPDFSGSWARDPVLMDLFVPSLGLGPLVNVSGYRLAGVGNYDSPILQPWAAAIVKKHGDAVASGHPPEDASTTCHPFGMPLFHKVRGNVQLLQRPDEVVIISQNDNQFRSIHLTGRHPANLQPTWYGHSIGHYEGDTLVVDTVGIKINEFSVVDRFGTPNTNALHVVERYKVVRVNRNKALRVDIEVEDPGTFTAPWTAYQIYFESEDTDWQEGLCAENNRESGNTPEDKTYRPPL